MQAEYQPLKGKGKQNHEEDLYINVESGYDPAVSSTKAEIEWPSVAGIFLNVLFYLLTALILLPFSFFTVEPQEHALVIFWGSLVKVVKKPGTVCSTHTRH